MTIDMHAHFVPEPLAAALRQRQLAPCIEMLADGSERFRMPHGTLAFTADYHDVKARLAFMDEHGVSRQLLSFPGLFGLDSLPAEECLPLLRLFNDQVAALARRHPGRFGGLAALPIADLDLAVDEYRRAREQLGLAGAILPNNAFVTADRAARLAPLFAAAQALGGHLFIHPGRRPDEVTAGGAPAVPSPPGAQWLERQALDLQHAVAHCMVTLLYSEFLDPYPEVSLHVANLGGTLALVVERMDNVVLTRYPASTLPSARLGRVHVDISSLGPRALELAVAMFGAERLLFGSDCPIFSTRRSLEAVAAARISDAERAAILSGNAARLLGGGRA